MVDFYISFSTTFTVDQQPHYIYSPRELTRWKLALCEALEGGTTRDTGDFKKRASGEKGWTGGEHLETAPGDSDITLTQLVRTFAHEGLRIFSDRLVTDAEREKTDTMLDDIVRRWVQPHGDVELALLRPSFRT